MGMQLKWGTYAFPAGGVKVTSRQQIVRDSAGVPWKEVRSITADGYLEAVGQAACTTAQLALEAELAKPFKDLIFYRDDGGQSATLLTNADSITGVVISDGPNFQDVMGPEYVTQRHFVFTAEADYFVTRHNGILDWTETVSTSGGGPLFVCKPAIEGPPQRQMVYQQTPCVASQSGYAVGSVGYPVPPGPIWSFALKNSPDIKRTAPKKMGLSGYTEWRIDWSYTFEWPFPLFGLPNPWPLG